jgi:hypothetical protein
MTAGCTPLRVPRALKHAHLDSQFGDGVERGRERAEPARRVGRELTILGFDKRGDLLHERDEPVRQPPEVVVGGRGLRRHVHDRAVELGQRVVVSPVGVEAFAFQALHVRKGHLHAMLFCAVGRRQIAGGGWTISK